MECLENKELMEIHGGFSKLLRYGIYGLFAAGVFIASVIYGYIHPEKC